MNSDVVDKKLNEYFSGRVVRKDLTQAVKSGANVPTFVLEYLLGMYCATDDEEAIEVGLKKVKDILDKNFMRYDESNLIRSRIRELGSYTVIDKISAELNAQYDIYEASLTNLDIGTFTLSPDYIKKYEKILMGGIWTITRISYKNRAEEEYSEDTIVPDKSKSKRKKYVEALDSPFQIESIKPIQMPDIDFNEIIENRKNFSKEEWIALLLRSCGFEPENLSTKEKWHLLMRLVPLVEKNYNMVELGPRSTGKSYIYKEISPYSILVSGGYSSVANLFFNLSTRSVGLVGLWDVIAFDEVAGIKYKELDGIQIMKDYMTSGSFARGREAINAEGSLVFIGNINEKPEILLKISHLFSPFPDEFNNDSAFFDRIHCYLPGWEVPKLKSDLFTDHFGFITDYFSEFLRAMRKKDLTHVLNKYFTFNKDVNKRDEIAIRKTVSGLVKIMYPDLNYTKEEIKELLEYAIEGRRRVKEQLKKMIGHEFSAINLGYTDNETNEEVIVYTTEQSKDSLISNSTSKPGHVYGIGLGYATDLMGLFKLENKTVIGEGKFTTEGIGRHTSIRECFNASWQHFREKGKYVSPEIRIEDYDYLFSFIDSQGTGLCDNISLAEFIGLCSAALKTPVLDGLAVVGHYNLAGSLSEIKNLNDYFRVAKNAGATKILLPLTVIEELSKVPTEYLSAVQTIFYTDQIDAAKKALSLQA